MSLSNVIVSYTSLIISYFLVSLISFTMSGCVVFTLPRPWCMIVPQCFASSKTEAILHHLIQELSRPPLHPPPRSRREGWSNVELTRELNFYRGERDVNVYTKFLIRLRESVVLGCAVHSNSTNWEGSLKTDDQKVPWCCNGTWHISRLTRQLYIPNSPHHTAS